MLKEERKIPAEIKNILQKLTHHRYIEITRRGNSAIQSSISLLPQGSIILIPEEGGWLGYQKIPEKLGRKTAEVKCDDARINLNDLKDKLSSIKPAAFIYQNPGGYFAEQPGEKIYELCRKHGCLAIVDVSGSIGTRLCNGNYADILVGSFGKWKLVEARVGGFISFKEKKLYEKAKAFIEKLDDESSLKIIKDKLNNLQGRINFLLDKRKKIMEDLTKLNLVRADDLGFIVAVKFSTYEEKQTIINYCKKNGWEWTECPRYIRLNKKAISIEVKRLE